MKYTLLILYFISNSLQAQEDCIFNNDYKGLTKQWIQKCDSLTPYLWVDSSKSYLRQISDSESLELSQGGCAHYSWDLILVVSQTDNFENHNFWLGKALILARKFEMDPFIAPLENNQLKIVYRTQDLIQFMFPYDDVTSTYLSEGVILQRKKGKIILSMNYYIN